jgi:hypothetical protein
MTTIIVTGGAGFCDRARIYAELSATHNLYPITRMLVSDASKAEKIAAGWAGEMGIPVATFMLDYTMPRLDAVALRHQLMICQQPNLVLAFPGGASTADLINQSKLAEIKIVRA